MCCCCRCTAMVATSTCCSLTHSNPTTESSSQRPGKLDSCLISIPKAAMSKAHQRPFGSLKYPLHRQSTPRVHEAFRPVTIGCFCHSFPVRHTSASQGDSSWDPPLTPEIQMESVSLQSDGIRVQCTSASTRALYSCGADVPDHQIHVVQ